MAQKVKISTSTLQYLKAKSRKGQSIVMVVVAGALIAGIGMAMSRFLLDGQKGQKSVQANYEITNLKEDIRQILTDPDSCKKTFENLVPWPVNVAPLDITTIKNKLNVSRYTVGNKYGDNTIILESMKLGAFSQDPATSIQGVATLTLNFKKVGESFGSKISTKTLDLNVSVLSALDPKITACSVSNSGSGDAAEKKWVLAAMDDMSGSGQCFETTGTCDGTYYAQASSHLLYNCLATTGANNLTRFTSLTPCGATSSYNPLGYVISVNNALGNYAMTNGGVNVFGSSIQVKVCCKKPPTL